MSAQSREQVFGAAISRGLNWLLLASIVMLLFALVYQPVQNETLLLVGLPLVVAAIAATIATAKN